MGRITTPPYRIEFTCVGSVQTPAVWRVKGSGQLPGYGSPNNANLAKYMAFTNASYLPGGCNEHVTKAFGQGAIPVAARIVRQADGEIVATWTKETI